MKSMSLAFLIFIASATVQAEVDCIVGAENCVATHGVEEKYSKPSNDMREAVDRFKVEYSQLNAIGVVATPGVPGHGTGFLISPCHVLTNVHVVFENPLNARKNARVQFSVGQTSDRKKQFSIPSVNGKVIAYGVVSGEFDKKTQEFKMYKGSSNSDWALIKLSRSIAKKNNKPGEVGYLPFVQVPVEILGKMDVQTAGFPGSRTENGEDLSTIYIDKHCKIFGFSVSGYAFHTCQTTPGQSGSPLLAMHNGKYHVVGMVSGGNTNSSNMDRSTDPDHANIAVKFSSGKDIGVLTSGDKIVEAVKADKCE